GCPYLVSCGATRPLSDHSHWNGTVHVIAVARHGNSRWCSYLFSSISSLVEVHSTMILALFNKHAGRSVSKYGIEQRKREGCQLTQARFAFLPSLSCIYIHNRLPLLRHV